MYKKGLIHLLWLLSFKGLFVLCLSRMWLDVMQAETDGKVISMSVCFISLSLRKWAVYAVNSVL